MEEILMKKLELKNGNIDDDGFQIFNHLNMMMGPIIDGKSLTVPQFAIHNFKVTLNRLGIEKSVEMLTSLSVLKDEKYDYFHKILEYNLIVREILDKKPELKKYIELT